MIPNINISDKSQWVNTFKNITIFWNLIQIHQRSGWLTENAIVLQQYFFHVSFCMPFVGMGICIPSKQGGSEWQNPDLDWHTTASIITISVKCSHYYILIFLNNGSFSCWSKWHLQRKLLNKFFRAAFQRVANSSNKSKKIKVNLNTHVILKKQYLSIFYSLINPPRQKVRQDQKRNIVIKHLFQYITFGFLPCRSDHRRPNVSCGFTTEFS